MSRNRITPVLFLPLCLLVFGQCGAPSEEIERPISIIPAPVSMQPGSGSFTLSANTSISAPADARSVADYLVGRLQPATGYSLTVSEGGSGGIVLALNETANAELGDEGYRLEATSSSVKITANKPAGLFYGVQTLLQLLPAEIESAETVTGVKWTVPAVSVLDYPRFGWRGLMLDVSRHFFDKEYVKEYIDQMAKYKFNRFHWHLTDDNGWRVEIKSFPRLTSVGAWRVPRTGTFGQNAPPKPGEKPTYGGFYTQDDIKEIVQYAKDRFVEILPEIDMPGHSMAAISAYPLLSVTKDTATKVNPGSSFANWFGNGKFEMMIDNTLNPTDDYVYDFAGKVFGELATMFPFDYIHIGGDECYKGFWERDAKVRQFMKQHDLANGEELQSYFTKRLVDIIAEKGKKTIGWDEILEGGLAPGAAVMSWRGVRGGIEAAKQKHEVVMSPSPVWYLDMIQGDRSVEAPVYNSSRLKDVYTFNMLEGVDTTYVLGGQGNVWTEQIPTEAQADYMTYPRALAIAENTWSRESSKDWSNFAGRVQTEFARMDEARVNYSTSMYDPIISVSRNENEQLVVTLTTEIDGLDLYYTIDNSIPNEYFPKYTGPIVFPPDVDMFKVVSYRDGKQIGKLITLRTEDLERRIRRNRE